MFTEKQKELLWSHVEIKGPDDCWNWLLSLDKFGYGKSKIGGKYYISHRAAYQMHANEIITKEVFLLHSCDNPKCCNPNHLFRGTHLDNMKDKSSKNRVSRIYTPKKLTKEKVDEIRRLFASGTPKLKLGRMFGVSPQSIRSIINMEYWK